MVGAYVYWIGWIMWVIVTFFWGKSPERLKFAIGLLLLFILLPIEGRIANVEVQIVFIFFTIYLFAQLKNKRFLGLIYMILSSLIVGAAYSGLQFMFIYDPVVQLIDGRWMAACLTSAVAYFLSHSMKQRLITSALGLILGELFIGVYIHHQLHLHHVIGNLYFWDTLAIVGLLFGLGWVLNQLSQYIRSIAMQGDRSESISTESLFGESTSFHKSSRINRL